MSASTARPARACGLAEQLVAAYVSWKAYMEHLPPSLLYGAGVGEYAKKHDPFMYDTSRRADPTQCSRVVVLSELAVDEAHHTLPCFIWISPNVCHDMHRLRAGHWRRILARLVPPLLADLGSRGLLFVTRDEAASDDGCCSAPRVVTSPPSSPVRWAQARGRMTSPAGRTRSCRRSRICSLSGGRAAPPAPCTPALRPLLDNAP